MTAPTDAEQLPADVRAWLRGFAQEANGARSGVDESTARVLMALARLIDARISTELADGANPSERCARRWGIPDAEVYTAQWSLPVLLFKLLGRAVADELERVPAVLLAGAGGERVPTWGQLPLPSGNVPVPIDLLAVFGDQSPTGFPVAIELEHVGGSSVVRVFAPQRHRRDADRWLEGLLETSRGECHPFRGQFLRVSRALGEVDVEVLDPPAVTRDDVVLPDSVWDEFDVNVHRMFANRERLAAAGLSTNRGVLVAGPPGVGKTVATRVVCEEARHSSPAVTVLVADAATAQLGIPALYLEAAHLAPAIVVLEDLDLIVGDRQYGGGDVLQVFLSTLDGAMTEHSGVVTLATTNDPEAIDVAARRACRFDVRVSLDRPDSAARAAILRRLLTALGADIDQRTIAQVASATAEATGAELQELVSRTLLVDDGDVTAATLRRLADDGSWRDDHVGQYL